MSTTESYFVSYSSFCRTSSEIIDPKIWETSDTDRVYFRLSGNTEEDTVESESDESNDDVTFKPTMNQISSNTSEHPQVFTIN